MPAERRRIRCSLRNKTATGETAPYFVEWVRQQLDAQFGKQLYEQGLKVYTTLDLDMQNAAERALERQLKRIEGGRFGTYHARDVRALPRTQPRRATRASENSPYLQGAFVALDPRNGAVRAMVGGRDFDDSKFNRATQALRSPARRSSRSCTPRPCRTAGPPSYIVNDTPVSCPPGDRQRRGLRRITI